MVSKMIYLKYKYTMKYEQSDCVGTGNVAKIFRLVCCPSLIKWTQVALATQTLNKCCFYVMSFQSSQEMLFESIVTLLEQPSRIWLQMLCKIQPDFFCSQINWLDLCQIWPDVSHIWQKLSQNDLEYNLYYNQIWQNSRQIWLESSKVILYKTIF